MYGFAADRRIPTQKPGRSRIRALTSRPSSDTDCADLEWLDRDLKGIRLERNRCALLLEQIGLPGVPESINPQRSRCGMSQVADSKADPHGL